MPNPLTDEARPVLGKAIEQTGGELSGAVPYPARWEIYPAYLTLRASQYGETAANSL